MLRRMLHKFISGLSARVGLSKSPILIEKIALPALQISRKMQFNRGANYWCSKSRVEVAV
ncbi:hypothetical protein PUN4_340140 [Paraburkholderia unamae]|nr:hypothetical protein PUN4_340140 [Paraburkholderia unamae]